MCLLFVVRALYGASHSGRRQGNCSPTSTHKRAESFRFLSPPRQAGRRVLRISVPDLKRLMDGPLPVISEQFVCGRFVRAELRAVV